MIRTYQPTQVNRYFSWLFIAVAALLLLNVGTAFIATGSDLEAFNDPARQSETIANSSTLITISMITDFLWYVSFAAANILIGARQSNRILGRAIIVLAVIYGTVGASAAVYALTGYQRAAEVYAVDPEAATQMIVQIKSVAFDRVWGTWNNIPAFLLWSAVGVVMWKRVKLFSVGCFVTGIIHGLTVILNLSGSGELASLSTVLYILLGIWVYLLAGLGLAFSRKIAGALLAEAD